MKLGEIGIHIAVFCKSVNEGRFAKVSLCKSGGGAIYKDL